MVGITYGIEPYGNSSMGWTNPTVLAELGVGLAFLVLFCFIEVHTEEPMFRLQLFKIRAFSAGVFASFLGALGRGGLMFMLIIWLQGIWLPRHGYTFAVTPLWAGIFLIPLTAGFMIGGPLSGILSDRYGSRPFATGGMLGSAVAFFLLEQIPVDFSLRPLRRPALLHRDRDVILRRLQPHRRHEQPPGGRTVVPDRA